MDVQVRYLSTQSLQMTAEIVEMCDVPYHEAVGLLMYLALAMRPDIAFTITVILHFSLNPGRAHWEAIRHIYRYLKGTTDLWLTYGVFEGGERLPGYTDADGSVGEDRRAVSGHTFLIDGGAVSWSSKKQEICSFTLYDGE